MGDYLSKVNSGTLYLIVGCVLAFITLMCVVFLVKSYRAGIKIGMDKKVLRQTIVSSATFTLLPSISILLGVIALSGKLGVPFSWLRLSVIGALQYELTVAETAAQALGLEGVKAVSNMGEFVTIALVMTVGILGGVICCLFFLKGYLKKVNRTPKKETTGKPGFGAFATTAMFVGLCGAYIGAYVGEAVTGKVVEGVGTQRNFMPLIVALISAAVMAIFEYFIQKKDKKVLENFSLAASMLVAMVGAALIGML